MNESKEGCGCFVVARGDSPEVLELIEESFHEIALFIELLVIFTLDFTVGFWWDDCDCAHVSCRFDNIIRIVSFIREHCLRTQAIEQLQRLCAIVSLTAGENKTQGIAVTIAGRVYFGAESAT